jgi:hypothetical protein
MSKLVDLVSQKTHAVYDFEFVQALQQLPWTEWYQNLNRPLDCQAQYLNVIDQWIKSSQLNRMTGLDHFPRRDLVNGTTQVFDECYYKYCSRRLRVFRGEYGYHRRSFKNFLFLEDAPLASEDWVIVSVPFCSSGDIHPELNSILNKAAELQVPVVLDCAYFGTCQGIELNVDHEAVVQVCFSLSKGLGLGDIRSGIRYSRQADGLMIGQQNDYNHNILAAAKIGIYMMEKFSPDHIPMKFRKHQLSVCEDLGIQATPCMHLGLGAESWGGEYLIDETYYRIGLKQAVKARFQGKV